MQRNKSFTEMITLGQLQYRLNYTGYDFQLAYINQFIGNRRRVDSGFFFYGDEPDLIVDDLLLNTNAFALMATVMPIMARRMAEQQPLSFTLKANTNRKVKPYKRFAQRLHRYLSHLYELEFDDEGAEFHYRKQPKSERTNLPLPPLKNK